MRRSKFRASLVGAELLVATALAGAVSAAIPTQADMEFCNQKATANLSGDAREKSPSGGPVTTPLRPGDIGQNQSNATGPPQPGNDPTGAGMSGSAQSSVDAAPGMASVGHSDPRYRETYVSCLQERVH